MGVRIRISGFVRLVLNLRSWISEFGSQDLDRWVLVSGFGFLGLIECLGLGLRILVRRICVSGIVSQELDL